MQKDEAFFFSLIAFIAGIFCGSFFVFPFQLLLLAGGAVVIAVFSVFPKKTVACFGLFLLVFGGGGYLAAKEKAMFQTLPPFGESVRGEVRVVADPAEKDFFRRTIVRFETCESDRCPKMDVLWQAPLPFGGAASTRLAFACRLELPKNFSPDFDYRMFLAKDGIGYVCARAERADILPDDGLSKIRASLYVPKHLFEQALSSAIAEPEAGLAKGLLLGGDDYLPLSLKDAFTRIGLSHMIAVSGYNITIIAEMLLALGLFLGLWRKQAIWTALVGIIFFIIMIGMPASAARAGAMASVVFIALETGRLARPQSALLFAGGAMLLFDPLLLRYDLGFELSFLATLGILWIAPYQGFISRWIFPVKQVAEVVFMTVAVELFVLPVILFSFHTFSPLIIIGNFLVMLVPFAMAAAFGAALLFLLVPGAHLFFAWVAFGVLSLITRSVEWLGDIGGASVTVEGFGAAHLVFWYIALGAIVLASQRFFPPRSYGKEI